MKFLSRYPARRLAFIAALLMGFWIVNAPGNALTLRIGMSTDPATLDPDALNAGSTTIVLRQIYEPLVGRDKDYKKIPALAVSWSHPEPQRWRFYLRPGVRFQDGAEFNADDVVFSISRAQEGFSDFKLYTAGIVQVRRIDALTVDIVTSGPDPLLPDKLSRIFIMDRDWAVQHRAEHPQDFSSQGSSDIAFQANGTGPYRLIRREPGGKTEMSRNLDWWGKNESGIDTVEFRPIVSDGARIAALLSGDVDLVVDVPLPLVDRLRGDARFRSEERTENRTVMFGMDVSRDQLLYSDVKDRNPFRDLRVRRALYLAIDPNAIRRGLMHGHSQPTAVLWAPSVFGYSAEDDIRPAADLKQARQLLAEAGYPAGFSVTLDCTVNRYVSDVQICQAIAAQLARIDVRVKVNALPFNIYVGKLRRLDTSFFILGWGVPTFDALFTLQALVRTKGAGADGSNNFGGYSNPAIDSLIDRLKSESNRNERLKLIRQAARYEQQDLAYIPLHDQTIIWAMRAGIVAAPPPENQLDVTSVRIHGN